MSRIVIILLLFSNISCGSGPSDYVRERIFREKDPRTIKGIEPKLLKYVESWQKTFGYIGDIPIQFSYMASAPSKAGVCITWEGQKSKYKQIEISETYYNSIMTGLGKDFPEVADKMIEQLVYHELGHCHLEQDHRDHHEGEKPLSIMRSWGFNSKETFMFYIPEHDYYVNELKTGGQ